MLVMNTLQLERKIRFVASNFEKGITLGNLLVSVSFLLLVESAYGKGFLGNSPRENCHPSSSLLVNSPSENSFLENHRLKYFHAHFINSN